MVQNNFERDFGGWHVYRKFYGDAASSEATLIPRKESFYLGVGLNIGFEGTYQLRITDKSFESTGKYTIFLAKRTTTLVTLEKAAFDPERFRIQMEKPFKLKLEFAAGILRGFLNDELLIIYDDSSSENCFTTGWCGVWIHPERAAEIEDFQCQGERKAPPKENKQAATDKFYEMSLEDTDGLGRLAYWSSAPYEGEWKVQNNGYCNSKECESSMTHLHVFERNPHIKMEMTLGSTVEGGSCGVLLRHAPKTAYVKVGYDSLNQCWFVEDIPALYDCRSQRFESKRFELEKEKVYVIEIEASDEKVTLLVDGVVQISADNIRQIGFGRIGLFAEKMDMCVSAFHADTPYATEILNGVVKTFVDENHIGASSEIEVAPDGSLVAVAKILSLDSEKPYQTGIYHSVDKGMSFQKVNAGEAYSGLDTQGAYQSVIRMKNGKYLQVLLAKELLVQESEDLTHWKDIGQVTKKEDYPDCNMIYHTSSLVEYADKDGRTRIFLPIAMSKKIMMPETKLVTTQHDTVIFYSDDGGCNWRASEVSTTQIFEKVGHPELLSYAECKVVQCSDGSLRLYNSRNDTRFVCYSESFDFGKTWEGLHTIKEMQCAKSSSAFCEDPYEPGTHYMAWVNDAPFARGDCNGRTRLSLARSVDGKNWRYLGDAEYMSLRFADEMPHLYIPLFQILDPSITVTKDYVYLTYGISMYSAKDATPGSARMVHHIQRPALARFEKAFLKEQPWDAASICNMSLAQESEEEIL